jgi:hypothetical protein
VVITFRKPRKVGQPPIFLLVQAKRVGQPAPRYTQTEEVRNPSGLPQHIDRTKIRVMISNSTHGELVRDAHGCYVYCFAVLDVKALWSGTAGYCAT